MSPDGQVIGYARILAGPTAVGKSAVAQYIAEKNGSVVLSADSMLVYRGMNIGVAKPSAEEQDRVRYFGVDVVEPAQSYSTGDFLREAGKAWRYCSGNDLELLITGGTGLYIRALLQGLNAPASDTERRAYWEDRLKRHGLDDLKRELKDRWPDHWASLADPDNPRRCIRALEIAESGGDSPGQVSALSTVVGLWREPPELNRRIGERVRRMFREGLLEETEALLNAPGGLSPTASQAIGYAEAQQVLSGEITVEIAIEKISARTRRLAKRQRTWFRHQITVDWVRCTNDSTVEKVAERVTEKWRSYEAAKIILPGS